MLIIGCDPSNLCPPHHHWSPFCLTKKTHDGWTDQQTNSLAVNCLGDYCDAVTPNLAFLQVAGPRSVLPYIKIRLQTCASLWHHKINCLSMCLCIWGFYRILLTTSIRPGLFVTDISKTYVSLAKKVMSTTLMENQAIKTNWGMV